LWVKGLNAKDIHREMLPVYGKKCLQHKAVHNWVKDNHLGGKSYADDEVVEMKMQMWLR
jgi:hypothetical protein